MVKIFLGGFPLHMDEIKLVEMVSPYGQVVTIKMVRDKQTKKCKGYAFLEIIDRAGADAIMDALDGAVVGDRVLTINIVEPEPEKVVQPFNPSTFRKVEKPGMRAKRPRRSM